MGTCENRLGEAVLTNTHNLCFEQKYEKTSELLSENFQFLVVKVLISLDMCCRNVSRVESNMIDAQGGLYNRQKFSP